MRQNYQRTNRIQPKGRRSTATNDKSLHKIGQRGKSNDNAQRMESMAVPIVRHCCCGRRCRRYHRQSSAFGHLSVRGTNCSGRSRIQSRTKVCECSTIPEWQVCSTTMRPMQQLCSDLWTRFTSKWSRINQSTTGKTQDDVSTDA